MYSQTVLDHFHNPRNVGHLQAPDAVGVAGRPGRGNYMVLELRLEGGRIAECAFTTFGCAPAIACGSALTEAISGRLLSEAQAVTPEMLAEALGGLPPGKAHCAVLAVEALEAALAEGLAEDA